MATYNPIASLGDIGKGVADIDAALTTATALTNDFYNDGNVVLFVSNGSATAVTLTIKSQPDPYGRGGSGVGDETLSIPAGKMAVVPFMNPAMFNAAGLTTFTLSAFASVKVGIYRFIKNR